MAVIAPIDPPHPRQELLNEAIAYMRAGQLVGMPTETLYGIAADALNEAAVQRVFSLKRRPSHLPLPIIIDSMAMLEAIAQVSETARRLAEEFWPGALSLVLPAKDVLPKNLLGGTGKVAVRLSSHPVATGLAHGLGGPITATSANISGRPGLLSAAEVDHALGDGLALILDGGNAVARTGSTVLDTTVDPPVVARPGVLPEEIIRRFLAGLRKRP
ncbi:MAG: L-threonylcarbamoyladenylate synthase [Pseudomonadota bacterium]